MEKDFYNRFSQFANKLNEDLDDLLLGKVLYISLNDLSVVKYKNPKHVKVHNIDLGDDFAEYLSKYVRSRNITKRDLFYTAMKSFDDGDVEVIEIGSYNFNKSNPKINETKKSENLKKKDVNELFDSNGSIKQNKIIDRSNTLNKNLHMRKYSREIEILKGFDNKINNLIKGYNLGDIEYFNGDYEEINLDNMSSDLKAELDNNKSFFNNILSCSLDEYQKLAVALDCDNEQIIAGAGTGKTLTLIAKVKYLVEVKGVNPNNILCLSFSSNSALELKDKLYKTLGKDIETRTFHALGRKIIRSYDNTVYGSPMDFADFFIKRFKNGLSIDEMKDVIKLAYNYFKVSKRGFDDYINRNRNYSHEELIMEEYNYVLQNCALPGLIEEFTERFKRNNYTIDKFNEFYQYDYDEYLEERLIFLDIAKKFYIEYELYLLKNNFIDFSDMINKSIPLVELYGIKDKYDYILIDEYQDTSYLNYRLIRAIKDKTNAKIIVVGDDWQSIYGFRDTDLDLFNNFPKYFRNPKIVFTSKTYRNSQELIDVASKFVLSNEKQIKKDLVSDVSIKKAPIQLIYYNYGKTSRVKLFEDLLMDLTCKFPGSSLLVLSRNREDIKAYLSPRSFFSKNPSKIGKSNNLRITYPKNSNVKKEDRLDIQFKTIHVSKGLEADNVIIIVNDNFPSQVKNSGLLDYVSNGNDIGLKRSLEERRLFYVALSRTRNYVFLFTNLREKSSFIKELESYYALDEFKDSFDVYHNPETK